MSLMLTAYQTSIFASSLTTQAGIISERIADYLWSVPSAFAFLVISIITLWFYSRGTPQGKSVPRIKYVIIFLFFTYTLFPLQWAQQNFTRSLDSFPNQTPLDCIAQLLLIAGTVLCCYYCFTRLPSALAERIEKVPSYFLRLNESSYICLLLILCLLSTGIIAYSVLGHIPHVEDSIAQLFQAKIFMTGKLAAPLPPHKEFFDYINIINDEAWYSQYPPGHSLLLMTGLFLNIPWLVGPVLGTMSLFLFFLIVKKIYPEKSVLYLCCFLLLFSPFFLFMSANYMHHSSTLFFILLFLFCYLLIFSSDSSVPSIISGFALGYALTIRPLTAFAIGIPFTCYLLYCVHKKKEVQLKKEVYFFIALFSMVILLLLYNYCTNDNPFLFGYQKHYNTFGFLGSAQLGPPHTLKGGVVNTSNNLIGLNKYLFEWPIPSLTFIFILLALPVKKNRWERLFFTACIAVIVSYFFYWYQDLCFGPRYYYSLLPFLIIFTVRGFLHLPVWLEQKGYDKRKTKASLCLFISLCILYTFLFSLPALFKKYSNDYWFVTDKIHQEVKEQGITNAIVFIDVWHPPHTTKPNWIPYGSGFQFNSPDLSDDVFYAMDLKDKNSTLMESFPNRNYFLCKIHKPMSDFTLIRIGKE